MFYYQLYFTGIIHISKQLFINYYFKRFIILHLFYIIYYIYYKNSIFLLRRDSFCCWTIFLQEVDSRVPGQPSNFTFCLHGVFLTVFLLFPLYQEEEYQNSILLQKRDLLEWKCSFSSVCRLLTFSRLCLAFLYLYF